MAIWWEVLYFFILTCAEKMDTCDDERDEENLKMNNDTTEEALGSEKVFSENVCIIFIEMDIDNVHFCL
jgi:hypothetical protein